MSLFRHNFYSFLYICKCCLEINTKWFGWVKKGFAFLEAWHFVWVCFFVCTMQIWNYSLIDKLRWEGTSGGHIVQARAQNRANFWVRSGCKELVLTEFEIPQELVFPSLSGSLFQCFTTLFVNIWCDQNFLLCNLWLSSLKPQHSIMPGSWVGKEYAQRILLSWHPGIQIHVYASEVSQP